MAGLTTHVLDTVHGRPAAGVEVELFEWLDGGWRRIAHTRTNADGRADAPLIAAAQARAGRFELAFHIGAYFRGQGVASPFLDVVPIRFAIADAGAHYHVPLVATPWSYSTYRGS
ncbi:MAG: hydroxyisourate hydrolase [Pseudomonadota bacterium]|nr:hydroxyisourate hydrolase [Pseudomonadota bacterium]